MQGALNRDMTGSTQARAAQRFALYIRTAKLICGTREYVCVIRDVSATGVSLKLFHDLPLAAMDCKRTGAGMRLQLQTGEIHKVEMVWNRDRKAGFRFSDQVDLEHLLGETGSWPKRGLRFVVDLPARLRSLRGSAAVQLCNLSQQGAHVLGGAKPGDHRLALGQTVRIECAHLPELIGKVRWRNEPCYGLALDSIFPLEEFAILIERLQDRSH